MSSASARVELLQAFSVQMVCQLEGAVAVEAVEDNVVALDSWEVIKSKSLYELDTLVLKLMAGKVLFNEKSPAAANLE